MAHPLQPLAHGADEEVLLLIIIQVLGMEDIVLEPALLLGVEVVILDIGFYALLFEPGVVLL